MDTSYGQKIINISMDIEDVYGNCELLDALLINLIRFLNEYEIPCDLYITGTRFTQMQANFELRQMLHSDYVRCGTHSNTHSFIPISCMKSIREINYFEESYFDIKTKEFDINKKSGVKLIEDEFNCNIFRCPGFCWSPDYLIYMKRKSYMFTTMDVRCSQPFQFMGIIIMPAVYKPLESFSSIDELEYCLSNFNAVSVYLHPAKLIYDNFWDKKILRGINNDYQERISFLKHILINLKEKHTLFFLSDLRKYYSQEDYIAKPTIDDVVDSMTSKWNWSQLPKSFYSLPQIDQIRKEITTLKGMSKVNE